MSSKKYSTRSSRRTTRKCKQGEDSHSSDEEYEDVGEGEESSSSQDGCSDEENEIISRRVVSSRQILRSSRDRLIAQILCRWWYVMEEWPPADYDFTEELKKRSYRMVPLEEWESADDVDEKGFTKVFPVSFYRGVYRDPQGKAIDMRPAEGKPCYSTLNKRSDTALHQMLVDALRNQLSCIRESPYRNTENQTLSKLENSLLLELREAEESLARVKRRHSH